MLGPEFQSLPLGLARDPIVNLSVHICYLLYALQPSYFVGSADREKCFRMDSVTGSMCLASAALSLNFGPFLGCLIIVRVRWLIGGCKSTATCRDAVRIIVMSFAAVALFFFVGFGVCRCAAEFRPKLPESVA